MAETTISYRNERKKPCHYPEFQSIMVVSMAKQLSSRDGSMLWSQNHSRPESRKHERGPERWVSFQKLTLSDLPLPVRPLLLKLHQLRNKPLKQKPRGQFRFTP